MGPKLRVVDVPLAVLLPSAVFGWEFRIHEFCDLSPGVIFSLLTLSFEKVLLLNNIICYHQSTVQLRLHTASLSWVNQLLNLSTNIVFQVKIKINKLPS